jgi:hypothetical protein
MGMSNAIDTVSPEESVREFAERMLQVYDLFHTADKMMFSQELERHPVLRVFKAGLPGEYSSQVTKILQELGVRSMNRDQQMIHLISRLQNYHEFIVSVQHDNAGSPSVTGRNVASTGVGNTPAQPQGYSRPIRRAYPATHLTVLNDGDHHVDVLDIIQSHAPDTPAVEQLVDDEQERVASLQEELVEVHANATFPSTMHPRGNNRAPLPDPSQQPHQTRQAGPPGASGSRPSTSRSHGAQGEGVALPRAIRCDICQLDHWTRNCPRFSEAMKVYAKHLQQHNTDPRAPIPVGDAHLTHAFNSFDDSWDGFHASSSHEHPYSPSRGESTPK